MAGQSHEPDLSAAARSDTLGFSVPDLVIRVLRYKKFLALVGCISLFLSYGVIRLLIPPAYRSATSVIPFDQGGGSNIASMLKGLSNIPLPFGDFTSTSNQLDLYLIVLNSRTSRTDLIQKFGLQKRYKQKTLEKTLKVLDKLLKIQVTDQNALELSIIDKSPEGASEMANYFVKYLNDRVIELNTAKAKANREFLEKRYVDVKTQLAAAEDSLQLYQQSSDLLEIGTQLNATVGLYSRFVNEMQWKQYEKSVFQKYLASDAPQIKALDDEIGALRGKIAESRRGTRQKDFLLPLDSLPEQSKKYLRLQRNVIIYNTILEIIMPLYEQARYDEQKSIPVLQVIDRAIPAEKKFFPPRTLLAGLSAIAVVFACCVLIVFSHFLAQHPGSRWNDLIAALGLHRVFVYFRNPR